MNVEGRYTMCTGSHPYIEVADTAEVRFVYATNGGVAMNVLNFRLSGGWTPELLADLAAAAEDSWETNLSPVISEAITLTETIATDLGSETGAQVTDPGGISGAKTGFVLPDNVTVAVSFRTNQRGRSHRGRLFHVGLVDNQVLGDVLDAGVATSIFDAYTAFFADIAAAIPGATHVIVSRCQDGVWLPTAEKTTMTSIQVEPTIDSMRKRLSGRGI